MNVALCTAFLEEDVWEGRLRGAASPHKLEITVCNSAKALLPVLELKTFSLFAVVLNGAAGLEVVRQLRAKAPEVPLLWIADEDFSLFGYQYRVTYFRRRPISDAELRETVLGCLRLGERK